MFLAILKLKTNCRADGEAHPITAFSCLFLVPRLSPKTHRPRSPRQSSTPMGPALPSPQPGTIPTESVAMPVPAASPTPASPASNRAVTPSNEGKFALANAPCP